MMKRLGSVIALAAVGVLATGLPAYAGANLQITEIWAGGLSGTEATSDWFELTNYGDMAATGLDGNLYYDDDSDDPTAEDQLFGIDTIAPGESVVYVVSWEDDFTLPSDVIDAFVAMWGAPNGNLSDVQIGYVDGGGGLGGGGDAVNIWDGPFVLSTLIDREQYSVDTQVESFVSSPDGTWDENTFAKFGKWGAYAGNSNASDGEDIGPPIGSPGKVVPEPGSIVLMILGMVGLARVRRRR